MKKDIFTIIAGVAALALLLSLTAGSIVPVNQTAQAAVGGFGGGSFGGRILFKQDCSCMGSDLIYVGPPNGGAYMVTPGTKVYDYDKIKAPEWVLGMAFPGAIPCLTGRYCFPSGFGAPVRFIGTSDILGGGLGPF